MNPRPKRGDLVECGHCGTKNEPYRSQCIGCGRKL